MNTLYDELERRFDRWDSRGRALVCFDSPVSLRPPFIPFTGHRVPHGPDRDTGRRHTPVSGLLDRISLVMHPRPAPPEPPPDLPEKAYFQPQWIEAEEPYAELSLLLPEGLEPPRLALEGLFHQLAMIPETLSFEIVATAERTWLQWAVPERVAGAVRRQMATHFPSVSVREGQGTLAAAFAFDGADVVVEFSLAQPLVLPLGAPAVDLFLGLVGSLADLQPNEAFVYQVLFTPVLDDWGESARKLVVNELGKPMFANGAHFVKGAAIKMDRPLYAVGLRLAARTLDLHRTWELIHATAPMLRSLRRHEGNSLVPVREDSFPMEVLADDIIHRRTRRWGMILNLDELMTLAHLPHPVVRSPSLKRASEHTRAASPPLASGVVLGLNEHNGQENEVRLTTDQRLRHLHIIGGTGSGKSTLLLHLIRQGLEQGEGLAVFDPHGDLIDRLLGQIPTDRIDDVILVDPSDEESVIPFNVLSAHSDLERTLLSSDLVSIFKRLSTSWGDQMDSVFRNAILAFLESPQGGSLSDLRRFLVDAPYRDQFLATVDDPDVRFYWKRTFPQLGGGRSIGPILTRLQTFLLPKAIRHMVGQRENRLDFAQIMDTGKILLLRLPQGLIGPENAFLLGSLFMAKLQQTAMGRQKISASQRRPFFIYIDEAQAFLTPSMREILTGTRKYGLGLALAHHELRQLDADRDVGSALLSNAHTRIVFKVGDSDARALAEGFAHFKAPDLQSLPVGHALCRIGAADADFNLRISPPDSIDEFAAERSRSLIKSTSRRRYGRPRAEVEAEQRRTLEEAEQEFTTPSSKQRPTSDLPPKQAPSAPRLGRAESAEQSSEATPLASSPNVQESDHQEPEEAPAALPGKGGPKHRRLQDRIRAAGEAEGFVVDIEDSLGPSGSTVDVLLNGHGLRIACEIGVTTSVQHELGNIKKCVSLDCDLIFWICTDTEEIAAAREAFLASVDVPPSADIRFLTPEEAIQCLSELASPGAVPTNRARRGGPVTRSFRPMSPPERRRIDAEAFRVLLREFTKD